MKKHSLFFFFAILLIVIGLVSCKKINEATDLGGDLIPAVDNINTFETYLPTETDNREWLADSTTLNFYDNIALGYINNDPDFGKTQADIYFDVRRISYGVYPFIAKKDSITSIDSVVLSLSYQGSFGDVNSMQSVKVFEIDPNANFDDTSFYKFSQSTPIALAGQLGTKSYILNSLKDSVVVVTPGDTIQKKTANVLRIKLDNSLGDRFKNYDTTNAYKNDSAFKKSFKGFAIKADNIGNGLAYFNLSDNFKTKLIIYYHATVNGKDSASFSEFYHIPFVPQILYKNPANYRNGQANFIQRTPGGGFASTTAPGTITDQKIYLQSSPGSIAYITVPGLSTFQNKVIHRAELIISRLPTTTDDIFTLPSLLFLDHKSSDTAYTLNNDIAFQGSSYDIVLFGGRLRSDNTYRFNITRHVQGIITRQEPNDTLRLYAPLRTTLFDKNFRSNQTITVLSQIANGRVVLAGGNYPDAAQRMRLRIIYSNL